MPIFQSNDLDRQLEPYDMAVVFKVIRSFTLVPLLRVNKDMNPWSVRSYQVLRLP